MEPSTKPVAGQAGAPGAEGLLRKARPFGAGRPSRGDQSPHVPPCPPGGIFNFRTPGGEGPCELAGLPG